MRTNQFLFLVLALVCSAACLAAESTLIGMDGAGTATLTDAQYWSGGVSPTSTAAGVDETDFVVLPVGTFRMPGAANTVFSGKSMRWGTASAAPVGYLKGGALTFLNEGLVLVNGAIGNWAGSLLSTLNGPVTLALAGTRKFRLHSSQTSPTTTIEITGPVSCADPGSTLAVQMEGSAAPAYTAKFSGDFSGFHGTLAAEAKARVFLGTTTLPGTVDVARTATFGALQATDVATVGTLKLADGARLALAGGGTAAEPRIGQVRVTDTFTCPAGAKISLTVSGALPAELDQEPRRHVLLAVPKGAGLASVSFAFDGGDLGTLANGFLPTVRSLEVATEGEEEQLCLVTRRIATMNVASDAFNQSALVPENADHWTGHAAGDALNPEWDYFANNCTVRMPDRPKWNDLAFGGHSLVLYRGTLALKNNTRLNLGDCTSVGCGFSHWGGSVDADPDYPFAKNGVAVLAGRIRIVSVPNGTSFIQTRFGGDTTRTTSVRAELWGEDEIVIEDNKGSVSTAFPGGAGPFYAEFAGLNTNFTGRITVTTRTAKDDAGAVLMPSSANRATLIVTDGRNLGGTCPAFTYDALRLQGYGTLWARADVTLDEPSRGILVADQGQFEVSEGCTLAVREQITLRGSLAKLGAGTLALGGRLAFGGPNTFTPGTTPRPLDVKEGGLKALTATGADGLSITFAEGSKLLLDPAVTDGVETYGLRNVLAATPFAAEGESISVALENTVTEPEASELAVPVCTVAASAADAVAALLRVARPWSNWDATLSRRTNDDGTVTFVAAFRRAGFLFLVR